MSRLQTSYLDLLLLHQQFGNYIDAWRDMEQAVTDGGYARLELVILSLNDWRSCWSLRL
ncbi:hypothetical protein MKC73_06790 [[Clostridium] innocuum]|nr:hypothetical protein [[Clostridium] innocuum]